MMSMSEWEAVEGRVKHKQTRHLRPTTMSDPPSNDLASYFDRSASTVYMYADR